ncbi:unnamed protein product [Boreogadus saida]
MSSSGPEFPLSAAMRVQAVSGTPFAIVWFALPLSEELGPSSGSPSTGLAPAPTPWRLQQAHEHQGFFHFGTSSLASQLLKGYGCWLHGIHTGLHTLERVSRQAQLAKHDPCRSLPSPDLLKYNLLVKHSSAWDHVIGPVALERSHGIVGHHNSILYSSCSIQVILKVIDTPPLQL